MSPPAASSQFDSEPGSQIRVVGDAPARFVLVDRDVRALRARAEALARAGVGETQITLCRDSSEALRILSSDRSSRLVAFVPWPLDEVDARALVRLLATRGATVLAIVPPDLWGRASDALIDGADDVVLTPTPADAVATRALLAAEATRRRRPAPWHRVPAVLREVSANASDGEVVVQAGARTARILVSNGRIAWVQDGTGNSSLVEQLQRLGLRVTSDELAKVVAECQRSGRHFADVLAETAVAERATVTEAVRVVLDARLKRVLADEDAVAVFVPLRWRGNHQVGFTSEELGVARTTVPPRGASGQAPAHPLMDRERLAHAEALTQRVRALDGCVAAAVLHYGAAAVVSADSEEKSLSLAWTLGSALNTLGDAAADMLACSDRRAHVARRLPSDAGCFVYAVFDLGATTLAGARLNLAAAIERSESAF